MISPELVKAALLQYAEETEGWGSFGFYLNCYDSIGRKYDIPGLGVVTIVAGHDYDQDKSYDGWTENIWVVFDVQSTLYKAEGTYTSYTGSNWSDQLKIVQPKTKEVLVYEEVK